MSEASNNQGDGSPQQILKSWSKSHHSVVRLEHTWILDNFSLLPQHTGQFLFSPIFSDLSDKKVEWKLQLYPRGRGDLESKDFVSTFLCLNNPQSNLKLTATFKLTLLNKADTVLALTAYTTIWPATASIIWSWKLD